MDWTMQDADDVETVAERALVPDGEHVFEIRAASEGSHRFLDGEFLMLRLAADGYQLVFCDIPAGPSGAQLAASLAAAVGTTAGGGTVSLTPDDLTGRTVKARTRQRTGKNGKTRVWVEMFMPDVQEPPAKAPRGKKAAAAPPDDDIPF